MIDDVLIVILGGVVLPDQVQLIETTTPNATDNRTLDGTLYTDFINFYRSWTVAFDQISIAEWNQIMDVYRSQFYDETYLSLECDVLGIYAMVKLDVAPQYFQWNGTQVGDGTQTNYPTLTLQEQIAIS